ncbi:hypothetical protein BGZ76_004513 [Entomortierella beljakovae]|nr:hypothetical protein BGZ76_004513 [Entomortierella beljakovae]
MYYPTLTTILLSLGLLVSSIKADTIEFSSPPPKSELSVDQVVPITCRIHLNGLAKLMWAKVHLMTEDGNDAGMGTIKSADRSEWQDSLTISSEFKIPEDLAPGKYVFHVYGSTDQPCEGSVNMSERCEGILSETLPVEIRNEDFVKNQLKLEEQRQNEQSERKEKLLSLQLRKRSLFSKRSLGMHSQSQYLLQDGSVDTKKMLYFYSLI